MIVADLIRRAADAGVSMTHGDGALQLHAVRQPPDELQAELIAHKIGIIASLGAVNEPMPLGIWLFRVARLLGTRPAVLLEGGHLESSDLAELISTDAMLVVAAIRTSPAWVNRPQLVEQSAKVHAAEESQPQHTVLNAATASKAWRQADAVYTNHLMSGRACHAATGRYCAAGVDLRQRYNSAPMEVSE